MSAQFIIRYANAGVAIGDGGKLQLVSDDRADRFVSEADAWWAAFRADLPPNNTTVVNLSEVQSAECGVRNGL